jgi:hypothetical protein
MAAEIGAAPVQRPDFAAPDRVTANALPATSVSTGSAAVPIGRHA